MAGEKPLKTEHDFPFSLGDCYCTYSPTTRDGQRIWACNIC